MQRVFEVLPAIAASPSTVLIVGETGTGKEMVARTIHALGPRPQAPFIAVNCGALPETLLESELFGYKAGAFTGANRDKPGRFALARRGTLFLDEIGEVSPALQIRLLRVLQDRTYEPLGGTRSESSDARIMVATNKDLAEQVRGGVFREDLYYRVNVVRIELPPLRRRKEDIPLLTEQFVARFNRLQQKTVTGITSEALSFFMAHDWPGNIRELENAVERALVTAKGRVLTEDDFAFLRPVSEAAPGWSVPTHLPLADVEKTVIAATLKRNEGNVKETALVLGIDRSTLYDKLKRYGIER